jgi:ABC-type multidrug transport system fused ATPase/permease subunit
MAWFDEHRAGELSSRLASDMDLILDGLSQKLAMSVWQGATFVAAMVLGFTKGWQLTLVILASIPVVAILGT